MKDCFRKQKSCEVLIQSHRYIEGFVSKPHNLLHFFLLIIFQKCRENIRQFNTASSDEIVASLKSVVELLPQHSTGCRNFTPTEVINLVFYIQ